MRHSGVGRHGQGLLCDLGGAFSTRERPRRPQREGDGTSRALSPCTGTAGTTNDTNKTNEAESVLRPRSVNGKTPAWMMGSSHAVHRRPRGVVGVIGTWNYPLFLNAGQMLEALTAGNAVVWKPSEVAPKFATLLTELFREA